MVLHLAGTQRAVWLQVPAGKHLRFFTTNYLCYRKLVSLPVHCASKQLLCGNWGAPLHNCANRGRSETTT